jgi:predicted GNAT family N-acyltransferase
LNQELYPVTDYFVWYLPPKNFLPGKAIIKSCSARKVALVFYITLGYSINTDEFIEVGIPHFIMEKEIAKS